MCQNWTINNVGTSLICCNLFDIEQLLGKGKKSPQSQGPRLKFVPWPQDYRVLSHLMLVLSVLQAALFKGTYQTVYIGKNSACFSLYFPSPHHLQPQLSYELLWNVWGCQMGEYVSSRFPVLRRVSVTSRPISEIVTGLPSWQERAGKNMTILGRIGRLMLYLLSRIENTCQGLAPVPTRPDMLLGMTDMELGLSENYQCETRKQAKLQKYYRNI